MSLIKWNVQEEITKLWILSYSYVPPFSWGLAFWPLSIVLRMLLNWRSVFVPTLLWCFWLFSLKSPNNQLLINISSFCRLGELVGKTRDDVRLILMFKALSRGEVSHVLDTCRLVQLVSSNACYFYCLFNRPYSRYPLSLPSLKDWLEKINVTWFLSKKLPMEEIAVEFVYSINEDPFIFKTIMSKYGWK